MRVRFVATSPIHLYSQMVGRHVIKKAPGRAMLHAQPGPAGRRCVVELLYYLVLLNIVVSVRDLTI